MTTICDSISQKEISQAQKKLIIERSQIMALNQGETSINEIAAFINRHSSTITRWIKRMQNDEGLKDRKRSGRPAIFTELIQLKTTAFFCQGNPLPGCNSMTLKWAAEYFNNLKPSFLGCTISVASISRILRKHSLRPHPHKYFLQITDPNFFEIMPSIVDLYLNPPDYLFSFDECPGIQNPHWCSRREVLLF